MKSVTVLAVLAGVIPTVLLMAANGVPTTVTYVPTQGVSHDGEGSQSLMTWPDCAGPTPNCW
jgi:hypothetical protein